MSTRQRSIALCPRAARLALALSRRTANKVLDELEAALLTEQAGI